MRTKAWLALSVSLLMCLVGCADEDDPGSSREYTVEDTDEWSTERVGSLTTTRGALRVGGERVGVVIETDTARGPNHWRIETQTINGQTVQLKHDDMAKQVEITVDRHPPVRIAARQDGKYQYRDNTYLDTPSSRWKMAGAVADDLEARRIEDRSVVATRSARELVRTRFAQDHQVGRLFMTFAFVDIMTDIDANLGVAIGNDISQDFDNH